MQMSKQREPRITPALKKEIVKVVDERIKEAHVRREDFSELKAIVRDMGVKIGELAEAQRRTEERVEQLAEAQRRTEEELRKLVIEHRETRRQLGGLSDTVGYRLEDEAFKALPELLKRDYGLTVEGRLKRQYVKDKEGIQIEVNIIGEAIKDSKKVMIVGEGKSQLSKSGVDEFIRRKLERLEGVFKEIFPLLVTYMISEPDVEEYIKSKGITLYYSYDF